MSKVKTINLKGKAYAQVGDRVNALHDKYSNCSIRTDIQFNGTTAVVKATVILDIDNPERFYTGTAMSVNLNTEKALEKLETTAVGRALAFAGFASDGTIATAEEMERFEANTRPEDNSTLVSTLLKLLAKIDKKGGYIINGQTIDIQARILETANKGSLLEVDSAILQESINKANQILNDYEQQN